MVKVIKESSYIKLYDDGMPEDVDIDELEEYSDLVGSSYQNIVAVTEDETPDSYQVIRDLVSTRGKVVKDAGSGKGLRKKVVSVNGIKLLDISDMGYNQFILDEDDCESLLGSDMEESFRSIKESTSREVSTSLSAMLDGVDQIASELRVMLSASSNGNRKLSKKDVSRLLNQLSSSVKTSKEILSSYIE